MLFPSLDEDLLVNAAATGTRAAVWAFLVNPGFSVVATHRFAIWLKSKKIRRVADIIWHWNVARSGCHIHLDAEIGPGLKLPHPVAVVIGANVKIGRNVTLYQGVTLGINPKTGLYPIVADHVVVFPQSVIVGGVELGVGSTIGAMSFVNIDVPPGAVAAGTPARLIHETRKSI